MASLLDAALAYAELGWRIHPCRPGGKEPLTLSWPRDASNDPAVITRWWRRWPDANVARCCGPGSIDVLDIDTKGGLPGRELAERARGAGLLSGWYAVIGTPSGGRHIWFDGTDQRGGACGPRKALELKANGGYVLVPPSHVVKPGEYEGIYEVIARRDQGGTIDWPAVKQLIDPPRPVPAPRRRDGPVTFDGLIRHLAAQGPKSENRNRCLFWACCRAVEGGGGEQVLRELAETAIGNGLPAVDAWATVKSAQRRARSAA